MWWLILLIVLVGIALRFVQWETIQMYFFDEVYYQKYTNFHIHRSLWDMPSFCKDFITLQQKEPLAIPPPTRLLYPFLAARLQDLTGWGTSQSLAFISATASAIMLIASALWATRMFPLGIAAGTTALVAVSLNELHLSQRIMIDPLIGAFCVTALWSLWELGNRAPRSKLFLALYVLSMAGVIMVKENAFFIYAGVGAIIVLSKFTGTLPNLRVSILAITVATGAVSFTALVLLCGGFEQFFRLYLLLVERSRATPYVIIFGDGPWYRYLVDSILAQPVPTVLAMGAVFWAPLEDARMRLLLIFTVVTYAIMCKVKYGQFYRYAIIWDLPIAALAMYQIHKMTHLLIPKKAVLAQAVLVTVICCYQFFVFWEIGIKGQAYALTTHELIKRLKIYNPDMVK